MRARFLIMGYALAVLPAFALPITHVEPGLGNAGPLILAHNEWDWIRRGNYTDENGVHCCSAECFKVSPTSVVEQKGGFMTPRGFVGMKSVHQSEDGFTWICPKPDGTPRCVFISRLG